MAVYSSKDKVSSRVGTETIDIVSGTAREYDIKEDIVLGSIHLTINGLENFEGIQFDVGTKRIVFRADCVLVTGDVLDIRYNY